jgi:hypothetical protein
MSSVMFKLVVQTVRHSDLLICLGRRGGHEMFRDGSSFAAFRGIRSEGSGRRRQSGESAHRLAGGVARNEFIADEIDNARTRASVGD